VKIRTHLGVHGEALADPALKVRHDAVLFEGSGSRLEADATVSREFGLWDSPRERWGEAEWSVADL